MTLKQKLILFYIYSDFANNQYALVKHLDRADFIERANLTENLKPLLNNDLIIVSKLLDNGTLFEYTVTEKGRTYIDEKFNDKELLDYVAAMPNPDFLLKMTQRLIDIKNGL